MNGKNNFKSTFQNESFKNVPSKLKVAYALVCLNICARFSYRKSHSNVFKFIYVIRFATECFVLKIMYYIRIIIRAQRHWNELLYITITGRTFLKYILICLHCTKYNGINMKHPDV